MWTDVAVVAFSAVFAAGGAYAATRVHLKYHAQWLRRLDRDIEYLKRKVYGI